MQTNRRTFTSESVSSGHPDKVADQISDAVVQYVVSRDPKARVAVETLVKDNRVILAGELTTSVEVPFEQLVRDTVVGIGYDHDALGFNGHNCEITNIIGQQSPDINMGVDRADGELGAGDQGLMFGIACDETKARAPLALALAHNILLTYEHLRQDPHAPKDLLRPDAKSQVTVEYNAAGEVIGIDSIVLSVQHGPQITQEDLRALLIRNVIEPAYALFFDPEGVQFYDVVGNDERRSAEKTVRCYVNPTGNFVIGGPVGDCGLTGRKIIVDTTGGYGRHGGGAFSGKDPSKVDRSAAYAARWAARNVIAAGFAKKVEIQLSYAIGYHKPVSILVDTFGTSLNGATEDQIARAIGLVFDFSPAGIIRDLGLDKPVDFSYQDTATYGHFGRDDGNFPWEKENRVRQLLEALVQVQSAPVAPTDF